jgi:hypothetical protein
MTFGPARTWPRTSGCFSPASWQQSVRPRARTRPRRPSGELKGMLRALLLENIDPVAVELPTPTG